MTSLLVLLLVAANLAIIECTAVYQVFAHNTTVGIDVGVASPHAPFYRTLIDGAYLPPECSVGVGHHSPCNITAVLTKPPPSDSLLTVYVPANGSILILNFASDNRTAGVGWNRTGVAVVRTPGGCNPLTIGRGVDPEELNILCISGSAVTSLTFDLSSGKPVFTTLDTVTVSGPVYAPFFIPSRANCASTATIANTVVFLDSTRAIIAAFTAAAPLMFTVINFEFLSLACPSVGRLEPYGDTFLLRCSTTSAFTFDPCHRSRAVTNHTVSIPYPCSASGVVAWMYPVNNSIVVHIGNRTVTRSIVGSMSEASCVNPKDPHFVYRSANSSVYVIRIQDGHVTMLGTSQCSGLSSSPALCSGLDFTEHEGSFFVGFFDGFTYKTANLSCLCEAPAVVGMAFPPDLSTSFVGPDEQSCLCSSQPPTHSPPLTESLSLSPSPWSPSQGTSTLPNTTPSLSTSPNQTEIQLEVGQIVAAVIVVCLLVTVVAMVVITVLFLRWKCFGKTKTKGRAKQESGSAGKSFLIVAPHSSVHSSSSAITDELEHGLTTPESDHSPPAYNGMEPISAGLDVPRPGGNMTESLERPQVQMAGGSGELLLEVADSLAVQSPLHSFELTTVPFQENSEEGPQSTSVETGHFAIPIEIHDVVKQDGEHKSSENRMNDLQSKIAALG